MENMYCCYNKAKALLKLPGINVNSIGTDTRETVLKYCSSTEVLWVISLLPVIR